MVLRWVQVDSRTSNIETWDQSDKIVPIYLDVMLL